MVKFTIIVPVYNDPKGIQITIDSLLQLDYPNDDYEILIVDNNSDDATREVAAKKAKGDNHVQILLEDDIQSSYAARNTGIETAKGKFLAFIDADMTVDPDWLTDLDSVFSEQDADYIGCNVQIYLPDGSNSSLIGQYNAATGFPMEQNMKQRSFAGAGCLAVRKNIINDLGGFDSTLVSSGDREFGHRVAEARYDQYYADHIVLRHPARTSLQSLLAKAVRIGRGKSQLYRLHPDMSGVRPWYHPFNVLPPRPLRFRSLVGDRYGLSTVFIFYIIAYIYKLFVMIGRVKER